MPPQQKNSLPPNRPQVIPADVAERLRRSGIALPDSKKIKATTAAIKLPPRPASLKATVKPVAVKPATTQNESKPCEPGHQSTSAQSQSAQIQPKAPFVKKPKVPSAKLPARKDILLEDEAIKIIQDLVLAKQFNFTELAAKAAYQFWHGLSNEQRSKLNVNDHYELGKKFYNDSPSGLSTLGKEILQSLEACYQKKMIKK